MKLNDPFGRLEVRHQKGYESMRDSLRRGGVDTSEKALEIIRQTKQGAVRFLAVGLAVLLLVIALFPKTMPIALSLALFLVVFIVNSNINGKRYIQRYIDEELEQD